MAYSSVQLTVITIYTVQLTLDIGRSHVSPSRITPSRFIAFFFVILTILDQFTVSLSSFKIQRRTIFHSPDIAVHIMSFFVNLSRQ